MPLGTHKLIKETDPKSTRPWDKGCNIYVQNAVRRLGSEITPPRKVRKNFKENMVFELAWE